MRTRNYSGHITAERDRANESNRKQIDLWNSHKCTQWNMLRLVMICTLLMQRSKRIVCVYARIYRLPIVFDSLQRASLTFCRRWFIRFINANSWVRMHWSTTCILPPFRRNMLAMNCCKLQFNHPKHLLANGLKTFSQLTIGTGIFYSSKQPNPTNDMG